MAGVDRVRGGRHQCRASRERAQQTPGDDFGVLDPKGALLVGGAQRGDDDYERVAARRVRCSGPVRARRGRRARGCVACRAAEPPSNPRASSSRWFDAPADPAANFVLTALRETGDVVAELVQRGALRSLTDSRGRTAYDIRIDREKNGKSPKDIAAQQQKSLVRDSKRLLVDGIDAAMNHVPGLGKLDVEAGAWVEGVLGAVAAAAGTHAGVVVVAANIGVASTGTAIPLLAGAAAENATMAWLGGGALAAGGGGMVLGLIALNFATIGPALLLGGFVTKSQGTKAVTKAEAYRAKVAVAIAELDEADARLDAVDERISELSSLLSRLTERAVDTLNLLESEPFNPQTHAPRFQKALSLVMAVRDVTAAPVLDASGGLTEQSAKLIVKYRAMTEEAVDA